VFLAKSFCWLTLNFIKQFSNDENAILNALSNLKDSIKIRSAILKTAKKDLPITSPTTGHTLKYYTFVVFAAGRQPQGSTDETEVKPVDVCKTKFG
jgi:hypothetical protein